MARGQSLTWQDGTHRRSATDRSSFVIGDGASPQQKDWRCQASLPICPDRPCPGSLTPSYRAHLRDSGPVPSLTSMANLPGLPTRAPVLAGKGQCDRNGERHSPNPWGAHRLRPKISAQIQEMLSANLGAVPRGQAHRYKRGQRRGTEKLLQRGVSGMGLED